MKNIAPTRSAGLSRLDAFVPRAGRAYAAKRNYDVAGHADVSGLSPYIRHRLLTEAEVLTTVLQHHSPQAADKFAAEVFWRTYWKGWLEQRPVVWRSYQAGLRAALNRVQTEAALRQGWEAACGGTTGIDAFDHWARELVTTGYMHNHARMWFASIWIYTLRLPWELGADFFLRHLLDGDPASNTLSWRWVGGLQTPGKTYLARAENIATYTEGRFHPTGLASDATPLPFSPFPYARPLPEGDAMPREGAVGLILTEDDLAPDDILAMGLRPLATATLQTTDGRSPLAVSPMVIDWVDGAFDDCTSRNADRLGPVTRVKDASALVQWAKAADLRHVVTAYAPVGPAADALSEAKTSLAAEGISLSQIVRPFDALAWPHASAGFFRFREAIPRLLEALPGWRLI
jgi:deoxyribodipyrimidine photo-lyase